MTQQLRPPMVTNWVLAMGTSWIITSWTTTTTTPTTTLWYCSCGYIAIYMWWHWPDIFRSKRMRRWTRWLRGRASTPSPPSSRFKMSQTKTTSSLKKVTQYDSVKKSSCFVFNPSSYPVRHLSPWSCCTHFCCHGHCKYMFNHFIHGAPKISRIESV